MRTFPFLTHSLSCLLLTGLSALSAQTTRFVAPMDGSQEVPPVNTPAKGVAILYLHESTNQLVYTVTSSGFTAPVTAAHIHRANAGVNGPVVVPLNGSNGNYCGSAFITDADVGAIKAAGLYINVHTSANPGGEIRGQILPGDPGLFVAPMDGSQEVPPVRTLAVGHTCAVLNADNTLTYVVNSNVQNSTAGHFHRAPRGSNGGVVIGFSGSGPNFSGTTRALTPAELADLRAGLWYVNVHSTLHPGGEIRGQVLLATRPTVYGSACPGTGGKRADIGADGFLCIGSRASINLYNARASAPVVAFLAAGKASIDMGGIGAPGCTFLLNPGALLPPLVSATDGTGCAAVAVGVPYDRSLLGVEIDGQYLIIDLGANAASLVVSNGLTTNIQ